LHKYLNELESIIIGGNKEKVTFSGCLYNFLIVEDYFSSNNITAL